MHMRVLLFRVFFVIPVYSFFKGRLRVGEMKKCLEWHFEYCARKVPTLRNQRKHRTKQGLLWAFGGFLSMCLYNNAAKIFGILVVLCRRFVNIAIKRCLKQAEGVDYQRFPLGRFFCYFFSSCRRLCRKFAVVIQ